MTDTANAGEAVPGEVRFPLRDLEKFSKHPRTWDRYTVSVVLHEVLHQYGMDDWPTRSAHQAESEEGVVSTVTRDLLPALERNAKIRPWARSAGVEIIHPHYRPFAARVYAVAPKGRAGKAWRADLIQRDAATRDVMLRG